MFPYELMPLTRGYKCDKTEQSKKERANYFADKRMAYKVARGEVSGNEELWKRRFPEVFTDVAVERANKTMDNMIENLKNVKEEIAKVNIEKK